MELLLSIVLPTYNESGNIEILIPKIEETLAKHKVAGEIIVVDDDSPDGTAEVARKFNAGYGNVIVEVRKGERGIAGAWMRGYSIAKGKYVATMDADLCHSPEDLMRMVARLGDCDFVIGSRYMAGSGGMQQDKTFIQLLASRVAQRISRFLIGLHFTDPTHSFRVFRREVFDAVKGNVRSQGNYFLAEFLFYAVRRGFRVAEVPIAYGKRGYGKTKLNVWLEGLRFLFKAAQVFFNTKVLRK
ncbi:polyprenol monophosphomannose synthase [Candidatus Woesearchaeota archaeon]|nr:polyprenol monophosphomannose synthase [Candidatus Woesearchaeota archaeon]